MHRFNTRDLPRQDRYDYWTRAVSTAFTTLDVNPDDHDAIDCQLAFNTIGQSRVLSVSGTPQIICRTSASIASDQAEHIILMYQKRGTALLLHNGKAVRLSPGAIVAMDTRSPYRLNFFDHFEQQILRFPARVCEHGQTDSRTLTATPVAPSFASKLLLTGLATAQESDGPLHSNIELPLLDLAYLTLSAHVSPLKTTTVDNRLDHAQSYIRANLNAPDLSPAKVAYEMGISVRTLQKAFATTGQPPSDYIVAQRLEHIKETLRQPANHARPIWHVAQMWGFRDPSHFARAFRAQFGLSAREWRARHAATRH